MISRHSKPISRARALGYALAAGTVGLLVLAPAPASAHFILKSPASWRSMDSLGSPQKLGPCGNESGGTATGTVTAFRPGDTITVTVDEKIFHPGHYRIALAVHDRSELPAEPTVTPNSTACGTVPVMNPPVFPVLADGVFTHTAAFSAPQSVQITLPANVTCDHCTLQIVEFMSDHALNVPGGCFYHHCADIAIEADGGGGVAPDDAGADAADPSDGGTAHSGGATGGASSGSGGCSVFAGAGAPTFAGPIGKRRFVTPESHPKKPCWSLWVLSP